MPASAADGGKPFVRAHDQLGSLVTLPAVPQRIVSLVPSQTELLFDLGLGERIVGITRYCIHPAGAVAGIPTVGGTKRFDFTAIDALQPDLIIGNKEENYQEGIEQLAANYPVWMSDIETLDDALQMIDCIGLITDSRAPANALVSDIRARWDALQKAGPAKTAYLIWKKPYMAVGDRTFIGGALDRIGLKNAFSGGERYPETSLEELQAAELDVLLLSSEPFPFTEAHVAELACSVPNTQVLLVDGEMFSWYGSRLTKSPAYFSSLLAKIDERRFGGAG